MNGQSLMHHAAKSNSVNIASLIRHIINEAKGGAFPKSFE